MELMCLLAAYLLQCQSSLCLHPGSGLLLLCFYMASLWPRQFLWVGCRRVVFAPSFFCVWSQRPWQNQQIILLPQGFCMYTIKNLTNSHNLWCESIIPKAEFRNFGSSLISSQFWVLCTVEHCISWPLSM